MNKNSTKKKSSSSNIKMKEKVDSKDEFLFEPGNNVVNTILNYSKALSILKSKKYDYFQMILN